MYTKCSFPEISQDALMFTAMLLVIANIQGHRRVFCNVQTWTWGTCFWKANTQQQQKKKEKRTSRQPSQCSVVVGWMTAGVKGNLKWKLPNAMFSLGNAAGLQAKRHSWGGLTTKWTYGTFCRSLLLLLRWVGCSFLCIWTKFKYERLIMSTNYAAR